MTKKHTIEMFNRLHELGISVDDALALRRISMTLHNWFEKECGDSNQFNSWVIVRDDKTDKPYMEVHPYKGDSYREPISDLEAGAHKRLAKIMAKYPTLGYYVQTDPRGASLYILRPGDVPEGETAECHYNRGIAISD